MRTRGLAGTRKKGSLAPGTGAKPSSALREGPGGPSLPQPGAKGSIWGRCLSALKPVSIYSRVACFIYLWVCFSLSLLCPRIPCALSCWTAHDCRAWAAAAAEDTRPGGDDRKPPPKHTHSNMHTQAHAHEHLLHTHTRVHMLTCVVLVLVYARAHTHARRSGPFTRLRPPDSQPLAPHLPLLTNTPLSHTNLSLKCVCRRLILTLKPLSVCRGNPDEGTADRSSGWSFWEPAGLTGLVSTEGP